MLKEIIDLKQILINIENIKKISNKDIIIVIKSDAYGLGAIEIAKYLVENNINNYAVVDSKEASKLIEANIKAEILILNSINSCEDLDFIENNNIIISVNNYNDAMFLYQNCLKESQKVHLQIETGMNRFGVSSIEECKEIISLLKNTDINVDGIYTHFTSLDNMSNQETIFKDYLKIAKFNKIHCAATSTFKYSNIGNFVRIGCEVYGYNEENQAVEIISKPLIINNVKKGQSIGYNQEYTAINNEYIAVLPIGYNDGFRRSLKNYTLYADGKLYEVVGNVCMNHIFVKVDNTVTTDTVFQIISKNNTIQKMAKYLNTVEHEILCMFSSIDKEYIK